MAIVTGHELSSALAKALGLEEVTKITIHVEIGDAARIVVERLVPTAEADALTAVIEEYRLEKKEGSETGGEG